MISTVKLSVYKKEDVVHRQNFGENSTEAEISFVVVSSERFCFYCLFTTSLPCLYITYAFFSVVLGYTL